MRSLHPGGPTSGAGGQPDSHHSPAGHSGQPASASIVYEPIDFYTAMCGPGKPGGIPKAGRKLQQRAMAFDSQLAKRSALATTPCTRDVRGVKESKPRQRRDRGALPGANPTIRVCWAALGQQPQPGTPAQCCAVGLAEQTMDRSRSQSPLTCRRPIATPGPCCARDCGLSGQPSPFKPRDLGGATLKVIWPCRGLCPRASPPGSGRWCCSCLMWRTVLVLADRHDRGLPSASGPAAYRLHRRQHSRSQSCMLAL